MLRRVSRLSHNHSWNRLLYSRFLCLHHRLNWLHLHILRLQTIHILRTHWLRHGLLPWDHCLTHHWRTLHHHWRLNHHRWRLHIHRWRYHHRSLSHHHLRRTHHHSWRCHMNTNISLISKIIFLIFTLLTLNNLDFILSLL